ncbi:MAG: Fic family protein [Thermoleophilia bacterium]|nr:Fic family protein [Thermoleophilia bacterium]
MGTSERAYTTSHPWITFRADLSRAGADFWMLLGEARSKVDHLSLALLKPAVAEAMHRVYLAKGAQATTAIEGNTLSEDEVEAIVAGRAAPPKPSQEYLYREVENIISAFNGIKDDLMGGGSADLTPARVKQFNREVLDGLGLDDVHPGEIRRQSVVVGRYRGAPWQDCEHLVEQLCEWLSSGDFDAPDDHWQVPYALIKAAVAHLYVAWIHPFDDGNGRTARLMELQILLAAGVPMPAAHLLSNHYNATRAEYYRQLEAASASGGNIVPFLRYAVRGFVDGIRAQVERVWIQQYADRWEQFVYETFGGRITSDAERRRLRLVLELSSRPGPVPRRDIPRLSPDLAVAYAGTQRMLSRDLNALGAMGLIEPVGRGLWRARREQILAFRPLRREEMPA